MGLCRFSRAELRRLSVAALDNTKVFSAVWGESPFSLCSWLFAFGGLGSSPFSLCSCKEKVEKRESTPGRGMFRFIPLPGPTPFSDSRRGPAGPLPWILPRGRRTGDEGRGTGDEGRGTKDGGRGTGDEGRGTRDGGRGAQDEGRGTRDEGRRTGDGRPRPWGRTQSGGRFRAAVGQNPR